MSQSWGDGASWVLDEVEGPHEASYLKLVASRARVDLGWAPLLRLDTALDYLVRWYRQWDKQADMHALTLSQIESYSLLISQAKPIETMSLGARRMTAFL
jgi:CDP-glucose 4,6-dehydratase